MAITQIIKYEGDNKTLVWKHPSEDFNTTSQLIVHETQEAVFFMNGQALDLFGPGRYTLETENIPILRKITNLPTGGESAFHCEVYFINKTEQMAITWGTPSKIQYIDPTYGFPLSIGASGEFAISVSDSRKLLVKLVGTENILNQEQFVSFIRAFVITKAKTYMAQEMKSSTINIFEIDERLEQFSDGIKARLDNDFLDYGMNLKKFLVTTVVKPDGEPQYEKFKELHFRQYSDIKEAEIRQKVGLIEQETKAKQMVIEAQGLAQKRATEGYTYQQERGFDIAEGAAKNESGGNNFASMGIGLGMMSGVGSTVGNAVGGMVNNAFVGLTMNQAQTNKYCDQCGAELIEGSAYCDKCGALQQIREICSNCGYEFTRPGIVCPKCGSKRSASNEK